MLKTFSTVSRTKSLHLPFSGIFKVFFWPLPPVFHIEIWLQWERTSRATSWRSPMATVPMWSSEAEARECVKFLMRIYLFFRKVLGAGQEPGRLQDCVTLLLLPSSPHTRNRLAVFVFFFSCSSSPSFFSSPSNFDLFHSGSESENTLPVCTYHAFPGRNGF